MDYRGQFLKVSFHWWRIRSRKSASNLVKSKIGVVSLTYSESEESERFYFLLILLMAPTLMN